MPTTMLSLADLQDDIEELRELARRCLRPTVKAMLTAECGRLELELTTRKGLLTGAANASLSRGSDPAPAPATLSRGSDPAPAPAPALAPASAPAAAKPKPAPASFSSGPAPVRLPNGAPDTRVSYSTIASFGWDQDAYGKDPQNVYVHIMSGVDGIGQLKERVSCDFTKHSFDLKIIDFNGKNHRLFKDNLDKDIIPAESRVIVKKNSIKISMRKAKGQYGYDSWLDITSKKPKAEESAAAADPYGSSGIMDMMKQMYDDGDDTMKKTIGEAMMKSRNGEAAETSAPSMPSMADMGDF